MYDKWFYALDNRELQLARKHGIVNRWIVDRLSEEELMTLEGERQ